MSTTTGFTNDKLDRLTNSSKSRINVARSLSDLIQRVAYASRYPLGRLSLKVDRGYLAGHRYNQEKKE